MESQRDYLNRRAREEQAAAERASDAKAKELHLELSARYVKAASDGSGRQPDGPSPHPGLPSEFRILEQGKPRQ